MRIVFLGPPGAGKGTQSLRLAAELGIPHLSTGEILRQAVADGTEVGQHAKEFLAVGKLVPDSVVVEVVTTRLNERDCETGCLFDGFPRTLQQAEDLDQYLTQCQRPLDLALSLDVPRAELLKRLSNRGRNDDSPETIERRLVSFERQTAPLIGHYQQSGVLHRIDGLGSEDEVFARIMAAVDEVEPQKP